MNKIVPFDPIITQQDRHVMNAHKSGLAWFSGLFDSGKSTLAHQVEAKLYQKGIRSYLLNNFFRLELWKKRMKSSPFLNFLFLNRSFWPQKH